jgi:Putative Ig domain
MTVAVPVLALVGCHPSLRFSPRKLLDATVGVPYAARFSITENSTPVGGVDAPAPQLPPGLSLTFARSDEAGELRGVPTRAGVYKFTVSAWCYGTNFSGQTGEREYTLVVH